MKPPQKQFPSYKWRWAELTPSENLNSPPVFIGVLRVLGEHEGQRKSSDEIARALEIVARETQTPVRLSRSPDRNLFRNSERYWKALHLVGDARGKIELTDFGRKVAVGQVTPVEFAATIIKTLELPNRNIERDTSDWDKAGLRIKPLELILEILVGLAETTDRTQAYITPHELARVVIPLAGVMSGIDVYVEAIQALRSNKLSLTGWPDCTPSSNDLRMVREFLMFLGNYGVCRVEPQDIRENERYHLEDIQNSEVLNFLNMKFTASDPNEIVDEVKKSPFTSTSERRKVWRNVTYRPQQAAFRSEVLRAYNSRCVFTGVDLMAVLEAAHIVPVNFMVIDKVENGICLRSDIHDLFDTGHMRLNPSGEVFLSDSASKIINYGNLPKRILFPPFVNKNYISLRWKYSL